MRLTVYLRVREKSSGFLWQILPAAFPRRQRVLNQRSPRCWLQLFHINHSSTKRRTDAHRPICGIHRRLFSLGGHLRNLNRLNGINGQPCTKESFSAGLRLAAGRSRMWALRWGVCRIGDGGCLFLGSSIIYKVCWDSFFNQRTECHGHVNCSNIMSVQAPASGQPAAVERPVAVARSRSLLQRRVQLRQVPVAALAVPAVIAGLFIGRRLWARIRRVRRPVAARVCFCVPRCKHLQ